MIGELEVAFHRENGSLAARHVLSPSEVEELRRVTDDPARREVDYDNAVALTGPAGSITIRHCRTVHGSATNTSCRPRRLLLHRYRAADAWPLMALQQDLEDFRSKLPCGEDTIEPRLERVPVRLPLPPASHQGSIYENQQARHSRYFQPAGELEGVGR